MTNVTPYLDTLSALGINAKDWLIKAAKSKTIWFSTALTVFGAIETFMPVMQHALGSYGGEVIAIVGVITGLLRFATTEAIAEK